MLDNSGTASPTIQAKDYRPPAFLIERVDLSFDLGADETRVTSRLVVVRNAHGPAQADLRLDGRKLTLVAIKLDGQELQEGAFDADIDGLTIAGVPDRFELEIVTITRPQDNTELEGLYRSGGMICTQCEAEGFRKITYFLDRPDVMARYTTTITADRTHYPVLLSNGNRIDAGALPDGRHFARWEDPFPKPSYLFALVAGDLARLQDRFVTSSGRAVTLEIYTHSVDIDKCGHAMASLKHAMRWDEQVFGREYDLDIFMIVAVGDFNMGAMENKGLNVFNTKYVLASPDTATDQDYAGIEAVIAHEYFHNWTGNRVTCRDWFQLSLKEGLTVFRDQQFSGDMASRAVRRIADVRNLRAVQFPEDASPMAHPVRPDSYMEISNFYTATIYNKGAELIRMMHTLLGVDGFRKGMDLYFERHDGQAVTCEDFVCAMEDATRIDLTQFRRWYAQSGTPVLTLSGRYDPAQRIYDLAVTQACPPTPGQPQKLPFHIPLALGLLDDAGQDLTLTLDGEAAQSRPGTRILDVTAESQIFRFVDVPSAPTPSLLRGFSAPVKLTYAAADTELALAMAHDSDPFARWEAGQQFGINLIFNLVDCLAADRPLTLDPKFLDATRQILDQPISDPAFLSLMLTLPSESYLGELMEVIAVDRVNAARSFVRHGLADHFADRWRALFHAQSSQEPYRFDAEGAGRRSLKNLSLAYLMAAGTDEARALCLDQFRCADNMTDQLAALGLLADDDSPARDEAIDAFYTRWQSEALVVDKWLTIQAGSMLPDTLVRVGRLLDHPAFDIKNPNKVRALIGAFTGNTIRFHAADGSGYQFLGDRVLDIDPLNGKVAARLAGPFGRWRRYDPARGALMRAQLERIASTPGLSRDVHEIVSKSLA